METFNLPQDQQPQDQNQNPQVPPTDSQQQQQNQQQQQQPPVGFQQPTYSQAEIDFYRRQTEDNQRRMMEMQQQMLEYQHRAQRDDTEQLNQMFQENPAQAMMQVVQRAMQTTVAPLQARYDAIARTQQYERTKSAFRNYPIWNILESQIDSYFANNPNVEPTAQAIELLYNALFGTLVRNNPSLLNQQVPQQTQQQQRQNTIPAQLSPSNPAMPINPGAQQQVQLNELEERMRRESGLSVEEFIRLRDAAAEDVTTVEATWRK